MEILLDWTGRISTEYFKAQSFAHPMPCSVQSPDSEVRVSTMTQADIQRYGAPLRRICRCCGVERRLSDFDFLSDARGKSMPASPHSRARGAVCRSCTEQARTGVDESNLSQR